MSRDELVHHLSAGLSLEQIGQLVGRDPSTVSYWLKKYDLEPVHRERHPAVGGLTREELEPLVEEGFSVDVMSGRLGVSPTTVRHWLRKHGLETERSRVLRENRVGRLSESTRFERTCRVHGVTEFIIDNRGSYRCCRCRSEAVLRRRRKVKEILIAEAGGRCQLCGYDRSIAALHFHHLDPGGKEFAIGGAGVTRSIARARAEAAKCALLCANCHAEVEAGVTSVSYSASTDWVDVEPDLPRSDPG